MVKVGEYSATLVTITPGYYPTSISTTKTLIQCLTSDPSECTLPDTPKIGYYLLGDAALSKKKIIQCTSVTDCTIKDIVTTSCSGIGKVLLSGDNYYYCNAASGTSNIQIISTDVSIPTYIKLGKPSDTNSAFSGAGTSDVLLKSFQYALILTDPPSGDSYILNDGSNQSSTPLYKYSSTTKKYDAITSTSVNDGYYIYGGGEGVGLIISCYNRECKTISAGTGYYINGGDSSTNRILRCDSSGSCTAQPVNESNTQDVIQGTTCNAIGKFLKGSTNFCVSTSGGNGISINDSESFYYVSVASGTVFSSGTVLLKVGNKAVVQLSGTYGYYLNNEDTNSIIRTKNGGYEKVASTTIMDNTCTGEGMVGGLIVDTNNSNKFYVCVDGTDENRVEISSSDSSTVYYYAIIGTGTKSLIGSSGHTVLMKKTKNYVELVNAVNEDESIIYVDSTTRQLSDEASFNSCSPTGSVIQYTLSGTDIIDKKICVKSCQLDSGSGCPSGYYLADDHKVLITEGDTTGTLYQCNGSSSCSIVPMSQMPIGYVQNSGSIYPESEIPYIACTLYGNTITCKTVDVETVDESGAVISTTDCSSRNVGDLIRDTGEDKSTVYKMCLSTTQSPILLDRDSTTVTNYFIKLDTETPFMKTKHPSNYVILNLKGGNAILNGVTEGEEDHNKYQYTDNTQRIYEKSSGNDTLDKAKEENTCKPGKTIYEYKFIGKDDYTNYYIENGSKEWSS